jgi:translation initiation factor IF-2
MSENKKIRLNKLTKELNVGIDRILSFLSDKGYDGLNPTSKVGDDIYQMLVAEFQASKQTKLAAKIVADKLSMEEDIKQIAEAEKIKTQVPTLDIKPIGTIDLPDKKTKKKEEEKNPEPPKKEKVIKAKAQLLSKPKVTGEKVDLDKLTPKKKKPVATSSEGGVAGKKKRKRLPKKVNQDRFKRRQTNKKKPVVIEVDAEQAQKRVRETLAKLQGGGKKTSVKNRREKRIAHREIAKQESVERQASDKVIKITEFATAQELATMMDIPVTEIISALMALGFMVTMNQRLEADTIQIIVEEFGFTVEFVGVEVQEAIEDEEDKEEDLKSRPPIVTIMGHVDHGKTSLLDYIRKTNVIAGESGGITQHIGAYEVTLENGKQISFLDTPGHEAFTAMRARGAKVTDIVVVVIAADDKIMPQTKEAINHAQAAGVPLLFAVNKIDRDASDAEKIKGELAEMNLLVEDWGGKYQSQDVSAKTGIGIPELLEKVILEAEMLELKANPNRNAKGTVIEASLDKGKGYLTTILVQNGTLKIGDYVLSGGFSGKVKALLNERGHSINEAAPASPAVLLGLNGAPQAGDTFNVMQDEQEAKKIAIKRMQLKREQGARTQKHITLDEIGRRIALGDFKEINIIVKGDVDGSIEALSESLEKLTTEEISVNIIHKSVGQISESDVMLAAASQAVIIGFQVRPSVKARKLAEIEQIDIRLYSVIYKAIEELTQAMEGMLSPDIEEAIVCSIEIREIFKISKVGTIAGCMVLEGKINRNSKVRIIRDGVVTYTGVLSSLKRFKQDAKEVAKGFECGLSIENFNDIKVGDIVEGFEEKETQRKLT